MHTPVLLLVYNRPEQTLRVLQRLKELGVTNIFVSGDGPKNAADSIRTEEVKTCIKRFSSIVSNVQYADRNRGCKNAVIDGINWFFDQVDEGIILEDDCLPSAHFFPFIHSLLDRYREAEKVWMISGNNPLGSWATEGDHFLSRIGHIWGWATWKSRWQQFDPVLPGLPAFIHNHGFEKAFGPTHLAETRKQLTSRSVRGEIDTWDYQWMAKMLMQHGLAVIPSNNLVENIGFSEEGTHLTRKPDWISNTVRVEEEQVDHSHPYRFKIDREYEMQLELCRRSNVPAHQSVFHFLKSGRTTDEKLRIVLINSTDIGGGAEKITLDLHHELLQRGHDSTLLVQHKKSDATSIQELTTAPWEQIGQLKPALIHVHNLHGTALKLSDLAALSHDIPVLFTLHDSWLTTGSNTHPFILDGTALSLLELREWKKELKERQTVISNSAIRFTAPSQWLRERLFLTHGNRSFFVPNGMKKPIPSGMDIPSDRYILFVANNATSNPYKDFRTLKKAWIGVNKTLGESGVDLICVSGVPANETVGNNRLILLAKLKNEHVLHLMENALFVVHASKQDNAPLSILEAHSVGKTVVASLVGGIPELLSENEQEFAFEAGNQHQLEESLVKAVKDSDERPSSSTSVEVPDLTQMVDTYLGHYIDMIHA